jgi:hypothetical protein
MGLIYEAERRGSTRRLQRLDNHEGLLRLASRRASSLRKVYPHPPHLSGAPMQCHPSQHQFYGGLDRHVDGMDRRRQHCRRRGTRAQTSPHRSHGISPGTAALPWGCGGLRRGQVHLGPGARISARTRGVPLDWDMPSPGARCPAATPSMTASIPTRARRSCMVDSCPKPRAVFNQMYGIVLGSLEWRATGRDMSRTHE